MENKLRLCVVTQEETVLDSYVSAVNLPTAFGSVGILSGHAAMVCAVTKGVLRCTYADGREERVLLGAGIAEVADNEVTVLVADARRAE